MLMTGLSGNEIYCLAQKGWAPGSIVVGNSVYSLGLVGGIMSGLRSFAGGEVANVTQMVSEGRHAALKRMEGEAERQGAHGVTGVGSDLKQLGNMMEFLAIGSAVKGAEYRGPFFTTACSGQDLFCQMDAGFEPRHFVIGNVAYALGVGRGISGTFKSMAGGEVKDFSDMYNHTRHLALERLEAEARALGANAVVDVMTHVLPLGQGMPTKEMLMVGTASYHAALGNPARPVTSELTGEELWNLVKLGYMPMRLLMGTSVYSLGISGGIWAFFSGLGKGEVSNMTKIIYDARENALAHIHKEANEIGADAVVGIKLYVNEIGGFVEVLAIGTAIKRHPGATTQSEQIPPQAVIRDRNTFFDAHLGSLNTSH